jgi:hypothetical protein
MHTTCTYLVSSAGPHAQSFTQSILPVHRIKRPLHISLLPVLCTVPFEALCTVHSKSWPESYIYIPYMVVCTVTSLLEIPYTYRLHSYTCMFWPTLSIPSVQLHTHNQCKAFFKRHTIYHCVPRTFLTPLRCFASTINNVTQIPRKVLAKYGHIKMIFVSMKGKASRHKACCGRLLHAQ